MNARAESSSSLLDTVKLVVAVAILVAGIAGFYRFADTALAYRVLGVIAAVLTGLGIAATTSMGRIFMAFLVESRVEVRKVIWPSRQETTQSTLVVVALVFVVGILLWTLDAVLFWGISLMTGQGN
ncbi:MAG TPA: preprotein translocase subunit SecE [Methylococcaceae bacterium]|jgi:preprotein translocase subunit SecE|nr:preprotein translocase subunit SecE [Methylococcaceae bacterium]